MDCRTEILACHSSEAAEAPLIKHSLFFSVFQDKATWVALKQITFQFEFVLTRYFEKVAALIKTHIALAVKLKGELQEQIKSQ